MAIYSKRVKKKITSPSTWPMNIFIAGLGPGKAPTSRRERENGDKSIGYEHDTPPADRDQSTLPIFSCTTLAGSLAGGPAHLPPRVHSNFLRVTTHNRSGEEEEEEVHLHPHPHPHPSLAAESSVEEERSGGHGHQLAGDGGRALAGHGGSGRGRGRRRHRPPGRRGAQDPRLLQRLRPRTPLPRLSTISLARFLRLPLVRCDPNFRFRAARDGSVRFNFSRR